MIVRLSHLKLWPRSWHPRPKRSERKIFGILVKNVLATSVSEELQLQIIGARNTGSWTAGGALSSISSEMSEMSGYSGISGTWTNDEGGFVTL